MQIPGLNIPTGTENPRPDGGIDMSRRDLAARGGMPDRFFEIFQLFSASNQTGATEPLVDASDDLPGASGETELDADADASGGDTPDIQQSPEGREVPQPIGKKPEVAVRIAKVTVNDAADETPGYGTAIRLGRGGASESADNRGWPHLELALDGLLPDERLAVQADNAFEGARMRRPGQSPARPALHDIMSDHGYLDQPPREKSSSPSNMPLPAQSMPLQPNDVPRNLAAAGGELPQTGVGDADSPGPAMRAADSFAPSLGQVASMFSSSQSDRDAGFSQYDAVPDLLPPHALSGSNMPRPNGVLPHDLPATGPIDAYQRSSGAPIPANMMAEAPDHRKTRGTEMPAPGQNHVGGKSGYRSILSEGHQMPKVGQGDSAVSDMVRPGNRELPRLSEKPPPAHQIGRVLSPAGAHGSQSKEAIPVRLFAPADAPVSEADKHGENLVTPSLRKASAAPAAAQAQARWQSAPAEGKPMPRHPQYQAQLLLDAGQGQPPPANPAVMTPKTPDFPAPAMTETTSGATVAQSPPATDLALPRAALDQPRSSLSPLAIALVSPAVSHNEAAGFAAQARWQGAPAKGAKPMPRHPLYQAQMPPDAGQGQPPPANPTVTTPKIPDFPAPAMIETTSGATVAQSPPATDLALPGTALHQPRASLPPLAIALVSPAVSHNGAAGFAAQVADVLAQNRDRKIEIALHPKELGQVRMSLAMSESGLTVAIAADRPETLDLMRRHIDSLSGALQSLGHQNVAFDFSGTGNRQSRAAETASPDAHLPDDPTSEMAPATPVQSENTRDLDMRL